MELVNHPEHYQKTGRKECIVEMQDRFGSYITILFDLTNCYKYLYRAGDKDGNSKDQDIEKAKWYYRHAMALYKADVKLTGQDYKLLNYIRKELRKYD